MTNLFNGIYKNKKVLITGHTGFKGSWLSLWLTKMGADVIGYSLEAPTEPNHYGLLNLDIISMDGDIRDYEKLRDVIARYEPEIVFHLAAQPLVRYSYENPIDTFDTNVMGTVKVFEACKKSKTVKAIVNVSSDKCYENKEWIWGYRETDKMGGYDPYSASKGCSELVTSSYRNSFFNTLNYKEEHNTLLASCRAGNVIGGGDWGVDRLLPDIMQAINLKQTVEIRNPNAVRPWQHVLEPLSGYLLVGQKMLEGKKDFAEGWNFGPSDESFLTVKEIVKEVKLNWDIVDFEILLASGQLHEANLLKLDSTKALSKLHWKTVWDTKRTLGVVVDWYKEFYENNEIKTLDDLNNYVESAKDKKIEWAM